MRLICKSSLLLILLFTAGVVLAQGGGPLNDVLSDEACSLACYLRIEPGVTTRAELETILNELNINFQITAPGMEPDINTSPTLQYLFYADSISPFIDSSRLTTVVTGREADIGPILVPIVDATVNMVVDWFGPPERIADLSYRDTPGYALVYPTKGLAFRSSTMPSENDILDSIELNTEYLTDVGYTRFPDVESCIGFPALCSIFELASNAPTAVASPDQTIPDTDASGSEPVILDGSGSSDPDGDIVTYSWTENDIEIATGATPTVELTVGIHTITLTVTDDDDLTASDEVIISVEAAIPLEGYRWMPSKSPIRPRPHSRLTCTRTPTPKSLTACCPSVSWKLALTTSILQSVSG